MAFYQLFGIRRSFCHQVILVRTGASSRMKTNYIQHHIADYKNGEINLEEYLSFVGY